MDPDTFRADSRDQWEDAASGWAATADALQAAALPVSHWLVNALNAQPGHTILELMAGVGDTGFLAAELIAPGGRLISTDGAEAMVEAARARAEKLGVENAEFLAMEAEWIDLSAASVDGVLCRWGFMLLADPEAALRETRRVLRPGGRVAFAAWAAPEHNPWLVLTAKAAVELGLREPPPADEPGPFSFADIAVIEELLDATGFDRPVIEDVDLTFTAPSLDAWWEHATKTSPQMRALLPRLSPADHYALRDAVDTAFAPFVQAGGAVVLPARSHVVAAGA